MIATIVALVAAAAIELVERLLAPRLARRGIEAPRIRVPGPRVALVAGGALLAVVVAAAIWKGPDLYHRISDRASSSQNDAVGGNGRSRLLSAEPEERLDYARVSLHMFRDAPILGTGAGSFATHYDRDRRYAKHSRYEHMIFLRVLGETGVVGMLAFLTMLGALLVAFVADRRRLSPSGRGMQALALGLGIYLLAHASLDWVDEFAAIAAPIAGLTFGAAVVARPQWPGVGPAVGWLVPVAARPRCSRRCSCSFRPTWQTAISGARSIHTARIPRPRCVTPTGPPRPIRCPRIRSSHEGRYACKSGVFLCRASLHVGR